LGTLEERDRAGRFFTKTAFPQKEDWTRGESILLGGSKAAAGDRSGETVPPYDLILLLIRVVAYLR